MERLLPLWPGMRLLIGAPVVRREWIIDRWLTCAGESAARAGVDHSFVLIGGAEDPTFGVVDEMRAFDVARVYVEEPRTIDQRDWPLPGRLERMVQLRNMLLGYVRLDEPDLFLSVDSDILLHPDAISNLIETQATKGWDAVGGYCYMTDEGRAYPSHGSFPAPSVFERRDVVGTVRPTQIIMAIKLLTPAAYAIDYVLHLRGEDIGFCQALAAEGLRCAIDARVVNKHVMTPDALDRTDPRCGY